MNKSRTLPMGPHARCGFLVSRFLAILGYADWMRVVADRACQSCAYLAT